MLLCSIVISILINQPIKRLEVIMSLVSTQLPILGGAQGCLDRKISIKKLCMYYKLNLFHLVCDITKYSINAFD